MYEKITGKDDVSVLSVVDLVSQWIDAKPNQLQADIKVRSGYSARVASRSTMNQFRNISTKTSYEWYLGWALVLRLCDRNIYVFKVSDLLFIIVVVSYV